MTDDDPKRRILVAATGLFAARGFDGVSVQAVADAVGMRGPSLLYHYRTKEALRDAVLAELLVHWKDDLPRVLAAAQTGSDRLDSALRAMLAFFGQEPDRARLLLRELLDRPDAMRALLVEHLQPWTRLLTEYIRTGQGEGRVRADLDPEAYVLQVVTAGIGIVATGEVVSALFGPDRAPTRDANVKELVRIARVSLFRPRPIDWEPLVRLTEADLKAPGAPVTIAEAADSYREILALVGSFAAEQIAPHWRALDRAHPRVEAGEVVSPPVVEEIFAQVRELGRHGLCVPRELGGLNAPLPSFSGV